jgi:predicted DNA-binding protein with PD1-like motif
MLIRECKQCRSFLAGLDHGSDIIAEVTKLADETGIGAGYLSLIGALSRAELGYYDQVSREYRSQKVEEPVEIASCSGNISLLQGRPFVHAHVVLANGEGRVMAGHLVSGTIFAAELYLLDLTAQRLQRKRDPITGLNLWKLE